jgi:hypothetical protein
VAGETEVLGESLPQRHFLHHKSHMTRPGFEPEPPRAMMILSMTGSVEVSIGVTFIPSLMEIS